jgi:Protein kinase domain
MEPLADDDPAEVAGYQLRARLGAGGMGLVYLAFTAGGRPVALKCMRPELGDDADFRNRFRQEVRAARRVHGLYTAQVLDADPDGSPPWLATAYVPGPSLHQAVSENGPMPAGTVLLLMAGVAEALQAIHAAGVVHRDLKPSNVLLAPDGPRVIDFGIARAAESTAVTRTGMRVGSPQFMAPEQVAGEAVSPAIDVFALGALAAYAAMGRSPFGSGSDAAVLYRILHEPADLTGCPAPLRDLVAHCLAKEVSERPAAGEIIARCRAQTVGQTLEIDHSWLPPALAAMLARHAALPALATGAATGPAAHVASAPALPAGGTALFAEPPPALAATPVLPLGRPDRGRARGASFPALAGIVAAVILAAVLVAVLLMRHGPAAAGSSPPRPKWFAGTWTGSVYQPTGLIQHWTIELTFPAAGRVGRFRAISLHCSGNLVVTRAGQATAAMYEQVTRDPANACAAGGLVNLTRTGRNGMDVAWQDSGDVNNVGTGHLTRG